VDKGETGDAEVEIGSEAQSFNVFDFLDSVVGVEEERGVVDWAISDDDGPQDHPHQFSQQGSVSRAKYIIVEDERVGKGDTGDAEMEIDSARSFNVFDFLDSMVGEEKQEGVVDSIISNSENIRKFPAQRILPESKDSGSSRPFPPSSTPSRSAQKGTVIKIPGEQTRSRSNAHFMSLISTAFGERNESVDEALATVSGDSKGTSLTEKLYGFPMKHHPLISVGCYAASWMMQISRWSTFCISAAESVAILRAYLSEKAGMSRQP